MTKGTQFLLSSAFAALVGFPAVAQEAALANITCAAFAALDDDTRANALTQIGEVYMADTVEGVDPSPESTDDAPTDSMASDNDADAAAATDEAMTGDGTETTTDPAAEAPEDDAATEPTDGTAAAEGEASGDVAADAEPSGDLSAEIAAACEDNDDAMVLDVLQAPTN